MKSSSGKVYALAESDQPGLYLVDTVTGVQEVQVTDVVDDMYFGADGRTYPKAQVLGFIYSIIQVNDDKEAS